PVTRLMNIQTHSIRVEVYNHKISEARINVGDVLLPYETYKHHLKEEVEIPKLKENIVGKNNIISGAVTPDKTSFIKLSKNMINEKTLESGFTLSQTNGEKVPNSSNSVTEKIKVKPNTTYTATISR